MDWSGEPTLCFEMNGKEGMILPRAAEMLSYSAYYDNDHPNGWPCDPETGEPLPIWEPPTMIQRLRKWVRRCWKSEP